MRKTVIILSALAASLAAQQRGYGDRFDSVPSLRERQLQVLTNACRMAPVQYRDTYIGSSYQILLPASYPAVNPLYWNLPLNRAARAHAVDMAVNCGLQHPSCDGTTWLARITSYYSKPYHALGENIATGNATALATMKQWILDSVTSIPPDKDSSGADGHRANIMSGNYREIGCGYAYGSRAWYHFWVQDFAGGTPDYTDRIIGGCHFFLFTDSITFFANWWDSLGAPDSISVVIGGVPHAMALALGTSSRGTYSLVQPRGTDCRQYYFTASRGGAAWRYPEYGVLVTSGEGSCARDYTPPESLAAVRPVPERPHAGVPLLSLRGGRICINAGAYNALRPATFFLASLSGRRVCLWDMRAVRRSDPVLLLYLPKGLSNGMYLGILTFENGSMRSERLVVER